VLRRAVRVGLIAGGSLRPLALMVMGALTEACFYVADADDTWAAREEVRALMQKLLEGIARTPPQGWQRRSPEPG
jgi:hypothetical protein